MLQGMPAFTEEELVVVFRVLQRGIHFTVGQRQVAKKNIQILFARLKKNPDGFPVGLADERWVVVTASNIDKTAAVADDFPEIVRPLPRQGERGNAS